jgi:dsDNA-specific endonuclease/ATPase MutS2
VLKVFDDQVVIETNEGFQLQYHSSELVALSGEEPIRVSDFEVAQAKSLKDEPKKRKPEKVAAKDRNMPKMEVDLHIHQLVDSTRGLTNHEMLNIQLETAKRQLEFAIRKGIQKVVFIHGVGEGILKEELNYLFGRYENIKYYDAEYQKYGLGATEVYIYQNL